MERMSWLCHLPSVVIAALAMVLAVGVLVRIARHSSEMGSEEIAAGVAMFLLCGAIAIGITGSILGWNDPSAPAEAQKSATSLVGSSSNSMPVPPPPGRDDFSPMSMDPSGRLPPFIARKMQDQGSNTSNQSSSISLEGVRYYMKQPSGELWDSRDNRHIGQSEQKGFQSDVELGRDSPGILFEGKQPGVRYYMKQSSGDLWDSHSGRQMGRGEQKVSGHRSSEVSFADEQYADDGSGMDDDDQSCMTFRVDEDDTTIVEKDGHDDSNVNLDDDSDATIHHAVALATAARTGHSGGSTPRSNLRAKEKERKLSSNSGGPKPRPLPQGGFGRGSTPNRRERTSGSSSDLSVGSSRTTSPAVSTGKSLSASGTYSSVDRPPASSSRSGTSPKPSSRPRGPTPRQLATTSPPRGARKPPPPKVKGQLTRPGEEVEKDLLGEALQKGLGTAPIASREGGNAGVVLSEEEKAMNGAPEGELFVVEVIETANLLPFENDHEIEVALEQCQSVLAFDNSANATSWADAFHAVTTLRRILIHHAKNTPGLAETLPSLMEGVATTSRSLRSALARNSLLCAGALLACPEPTVSEAVWQLSGKTLDELVGCLVEARCATKALWAAAEESLSGCVNELPPKQLALLVPRLALKAGHKNKEVAEAAVVWAAQALASLAASSKGSIGLASLRALNLSTTLPMLLLGLNGRAPSGKQASRRCLTMLKSLCGESALGQAVSALSSLSPAQHLELTQAAAGDAAKKKLTGEPRMSIAELREKHAAEQRAQAARNHGRVDEAS